ncbi:MAG: hypothetical protein MH252_04520 [Thermosynechococcaceae cyanobacterium MS004]|nr:hypothetical protein [Thermosynechococcaceae cyanobacterium MS004]
MKTNRNDFALRGVLAGGSSRLTLVQSLAHTNERRRVHWRGDRSTVGLPEMTQTSAPPSGVLRKGDRFGGMVPVKGWNISFG